MYSPRKLPLMKGEIAPPSFSSEISDTLDDPGGCPLGIFPHEIGSCSLKKHT